MYSAYVLSEESRKELAVQFPPKYSKFVGHHVTHEFPTERVFFNQRSSRPLVPPVQHCVVISHLDSGDGLECFVVQVNGDSGRPDKGCYHLTWSLDPEKYKPVHSNLLIAKAISNASLNKAKYCLPFLDNPVLLSTTPKLLG